MLRRARLLAYLTFAIFGSAASAKDLWTGVPAGRYTAGFRFRQTLDLTRNIDSRTRGTRLGLAIWYPAERPASKATPMTQLEYRLLEFSEDLDAKSKQSFVDTEAAMMVAWRHVGIVPLTLNQARECLTASGRAFRDISPAAGKFPVVLILGGPWYLSTTAEILASNGYLVIAPVRFSDQSNEVPKLNFTWYVDDALRDAEWALAEMSKDSAADINSVSALGHGGGGMQALLLTMRNRGVRAVANIDAGIFSSRTNPRQLNFYHPRLLRSPYLYIATSGTRQESDQYSDFEQMRFSRRYEVVLNNTAIRHHDLSDVGRAVSASLGIRGADQEVVLKHYADVQQMLLHFLNSNGRHGSAATPQFGEWLQPLGKDSEYSVAIRDSVEPAPTTVEVLHSLNERTLQQLIDAHGRDAEAQVFSEDDLQKVIVSARTRGLTDVAIKLARFAMDLHPKSLPIYQTASETLDQSGDHTGAHELAARCIALELPRNDWRAQAAYNACQQRVRRVQQE